MDGLLVTIGGAVGAEALRLWGPFAIVLVVLAAMWWRTERGRVSDQAVAEALRKDLAGQLAGLQDKRVEDARSMIRVTEAATATIAARSQGDEHLQVLLTAIVDEIKAVKAAVDAPEAPFSTRRPRLRR